MKVDKLKDSALTLLSPLSKLPTSYFSSTTGTKKCLLLAALDIVAKGKRGEGMSQEHLVVLPSSYSWIFSFLSFQ